jgi:ATP-dependent Clp protease ATP-binding subunit ClpA
MFERFTEGARSVVVRSQEEARDLRHNYIGTEHLLLGLLRDEAGIAGNVLGELGLQLDAVRGQVIEIVGTGEEAAGMLPFTPRAKKVLELALREALSLGHDHIGTEHVLLGLAREGDGVAMRILVDAGADAETIRTQVLVVLGGAPGSARAQPRRIREALTARLAVLDDLLVAWERRSELFELAAGAGSREEAARLVAERMEIDEDAAERILDLRLGQMPQGERKRLLEEHGRIRRVLRDRPEDDG